ncbi:MAG: hypothetical protein KDA22_02195 [Phycisphaerales bacterium]|nr:hypothetical protein [Phycisphaerales bacterium]
MSRHHLVWVTVGAVLGGSTTAFGAFIIQQQSNAAPTYSGASLNFDEPGGPTGEVPSDYWQPTLGITLLAADQVNLVDDWGTLSGQPWLGTGNSFFGNFGVIMNFDSDVTELSFQAWDPSGPPTPIGGGLGIFLKKNGQEVASAFVTPAWGGVGDSWFNITTTNGDTFDEIFVGGYGFVPTTYVDNLSWNVVPAPGATALFALAALGARRRRR